MSRPSRIEIAATAGEVLCRGPRGAADNAGRGDAACPTTAATKGRRAHAAESPCRVSRRRRLLTKFAIQEQLWSHPDPDDHFVEDDSKAERFGPLPPVEVPQPPLIPRARKATGDAEKQRARAEAERRKAESLRGPKT
eukprot:g13274.t1